MRIVLTGAGYSTGNEILRELVRQEAELTILVDEADSLPVEASEARQVAFEPEKPGALEAALADATHVVHARALDAPGHAAAEYAAVNLHATTALLDACRHYEIEQVLFVSTTEAYGARMPPWPVSESWTPQPIGAALQSRVEAERAARTYRRQTPLSILRPAPVLSRSGGSLLTVLRHFISHPRGALVGGGDAPISILAGADLGRVVWALLSHSEDAVDQVFHAASAHTTWRELAVESCRLRGVEPRFWSAPFALARALDAVGLADWALPAPAGVDGYVTLTGRAHLIDDSRTRVTVGYEPLFSARAALAQALDVYGDGAAAEA